MSGYDYVFRIGGPDEITEWALAQEVDEKIRHGMFALGEIMGSSRTEKEAEAAVRGRVAIHKKLFEGWDGLLSEPHPAFRNQMDAEEFRLFALQGDYFVAARRGQTNEHFRNFFFAIEPPKDEEDLYRRWRASGEHRGLLPGEEPNSKVRQDAGCHQYVAD